MPVPHWLASKLKADWACGLRDLERTRRRVHHNAVIFAAQQAEMNRMGMGNGTIDDDAVIVDSPSTVNHYHPRPSMGPAWIALLVIAAPVLAAAILGAAWLVSQRPASPQVIPPPTTSAPVAPTPMPTPLPTPLPAPPPASPGQGYLEFYRP